MREDRKGKGGGEMEHVFGIDFGTTNTRIAYFDGEKPVMIPVEDSRGRAYTIPTMIGYRDGEPVVFGQDAREVASENDIQVCGNLKWILDQENPLEVGRRYIEPEKMVTDFFKFLQEVVHRTAAVREELERVALTVPVNYPFQSRLHLCRACEKAGIDVVGVFHEPVAALYCHALLSQRSTTAAVFDWGGGTLDIATVRIEQGKAQVKAMDGMRRGGDDFDQIMVNQAVGQFLRDHDLGIASDDLIEDPIFGPQLRLLAEQAKIELSENNEAYISRLNFLSGKALDFEITRRLFQEWIEDDVDRAIGCLRRAIRDTHIAESLVDPILLSGGTCNIPLIQLRIEQELGADRVITRLPFATRRRETAPEEDVSHATAIGAVLLAVFGAHPTLTYDVGVRVADARGIQDSFHPIFPKGRALDFDEHREEFFITDTRTGVARLLLCELVDADAEPEGRLKRIVTIPIDRTETRIDVTFRMGQHLVMDVSGTGRVAPCDSSETRTFLHDLSFAFEIPENSTGILN
jgi:molecular chaperone DnaK (HSP70)